jgi:hypothetical protein
MGDERVKTVEAVEIMPIRGIRKVTSRTPVWFDLKPRLGRKKGTLNFSTQFKRAVRKFELDQGKSFMEFVLEACKYEPSVLVSCLNKMLPNKVQIGLGPDDVNDVVKEIVQVICKHVHDPETLDAIARDIKKLDLSTSL